MSENLPATPGDDESLEEKFQRLSAEAAKLTEAVETGQSSGALVPISGDAPAEVTRQFAAKAKVELLRKTKEIKAVGDQMRTEMERRMSEMHALMAPLQKQIKQMEEVIWTVNLYLGRDEEIIQLTKGEPASVDEILTLRQTVLSMDEETAAAAAEGGIDARNVEVFDEWICNPVNLARVLPEPKGVVALVPRRRGRDYQDPWMNDRMREENAWTYFLIRNGDNLYRMKTEFVVGKRLIPGTKEFTDLFTTREYSTQTQQYETRQLIPGTREWDKAEAAQGAKQRHYMRMALILQGLIDRTAVFHPLPSQGLNLLSGAAFGDGTAHLVLDGENLLTDGRDDFYTWLAKANKGLRPGMRIIGAFNTEVFRDAGQEWEDYRHYRPNDRITPRASSSYMSDTPGSGVIYALEGYRTLYGSKALFFRFERTTERWIGSGYESELRAPKTKGTCMVLPTDRFILPVDLVSMEDMRYYLDSRVSRTAYEFMMPLLHAAIEIKESEAKAEEPMRTMLVGEIVKAHDVTVEEAQEAIPALVNWWKLANRWHRALVKGEDPAAEAKAARLIVKEFGARRKADESAGPGDVEAQMVATLRRQDPSIMVVGRKRDGGYLAFAPQSRRFDKDVAHPSMWCVEYVATAKGTVKKREWVTPGTRMTRTRILFENEQWAGWDIAKGPQHDLTDDEIEMLAQQMAQTCESTLPEGWPEKLWSNVRTMRRDPVQPLLLAVTLDRKNSTFEYWALPVQEPEGLAQPPTLEAGGHISPEHIQVRARWIKKAGAPPVLSDPTSWLVREETRRIGGDSLHTPWGKVDDGRSRDPRLVFENEANRQTAIVRQEAVDAHNALVSEGESLLWNLARSLEHQWIDREWAKAKSEFMAEYGEEELWEDHSKSMSIKWPHDGGHYGGRYKPVNDAVRNAIARLIDQGRTISGMTVGQVMDQAGIEYEVPEDVLSLTLPEEGTEQDWRKRG